MKKLITEYDYKDEPTRSYQIIKELENGMQIVVLNGLTQTLEIKGLKKAMDYVATLNEHAKGCSYSIRACK
tara:strand:- start:1041 stop:1253 length:213 start_codon:yes stop_codon:yes gene_type:complete